MPNTSAHKLAGERLTEKRDEFRAALAYAESSNKAEALLRLTAALQSFWRGGYRTEGTEWMHRALALGSTAPTRLRLAVMFAWAWTFPNEADDYAKHAPMVEAALAECRATQDQTGIAQALTLQSDIARAVNNDFAAARTHLEEAWRIFETGSDQRAIDIVRHKMGVVLQRQDRAAAEAWMRDTQGLNPIPTRFFVRQHMRAIGRPDDSKAFNLGKQPRAYCLWHVSSCQAS